MSLDQEIINQQEALLTAHRRTLAHLIEQAAQFGGEPFAPSQTANGIAEARAEIQRIKAVLREDGVTVEKEPGDEAPLLREPVSPLQAPHQRNINTGGGNYIEGNQSQQGVFVSGGAIHGDLIGQQTNYYQTTAASLDPQEQRNRRAMLTKVKSIWIEGLLEQSLAKELRIALDLTEQPDAVTLPLNALVQELHRPPRALPAGTPIVNVFDQMGGTLLILGAPGAGKTTLLLELAHDLITRAEHDEGHPIPVVFNLSSWATKRQLLKDWLIEELNTKYDVPRKLAQAWMDIDAVLPLLDGLDEVAAEQRGGCVEAINTYRQEHGLVPLGVCSRVADYEALTIKLRLQGAIVVEALTPQQVDAYLERAGEKLAGVRAARRDDAEFGEMLDTPLMLSVVTLAYAQKEESQLQIVGTADERRRHLFDAYIAAMLQRRSKEQRYTREQMTKWLKFLATSLIGQAQSIFFIENFQPAWLPMPVSRHQYVLLDRVGGGFLCGLIGFLSSLLASLVSNGFAYRHFWVDASALNIGLVGLLGGILIGGLFETEYKQLLLSVPNIRRLTYNNHFC